MQEPGLDDLPHFPFVEAVINESLRLYPPAHTTNRECTAPGGCTLLGAGGQQYHLPQHTWVRWVAAAFAACRSGLPLLHPESCTEP